VNLALTFLILNLPISARYSKGAHCDEFSYSWRSKGHGKLLREDMC